MTDDEPSIVPPFITSRVRAARVLDALEDQDAWLSNHPHMRPVLQPYSRELAITLLALALDEVFGVPGLTDG